MGSEKRIGPPAEQTTLTPERLGVGRTHSTNTIPAKVTHEFMLPQILWICFSPYLSELMAAL